MYSGLMMIAELANNNLLLGVMPEYLGLLVFGFILIVFTIVLRWFDGRQPEAEKAKTFEKEGIGLEN